MPYITFSIKKGEGKGRDHFNFWSKSSERESDPRPFAHKYPVVFIVILSAWNGVGWPESTRIVKINQIQKYSLFTAVQRER